MEWVPLPHAQTAPNKDDSIQGNCSRTNGFSQEATQNGFVSPDTDLEMILYPQFSPFVDRRAFAKVADH